MTDADDQKTDQSGDQNDQERPNPMAGVFRSHGDRRRDRNARTEVQARAVFGGLGWCHGPRPRRRRW